MSHLIEWMIYPVSAVMKLWYLLLHAIGVNDTWAWIISLFGLIVTVRSLILPFSIIQYRATRVSVNLRPHLRALDDAYAHVTSGAELIEYQEKKRKLQKDAGHNPFAGCVPALIQLPVFLGLYQVLLRMARPLDGLDAVEHQPIGFLSGKDVSSFLAVRIDGIPLPAHVMMSAEQYQQLGVTHDQVFHFVLPYFVAAAAFTTINMLYSLYRSWLSMDYDSKFNVGLYKFFIVMVLISPLFPLWAGLKGPLPAAMAFYWFANSFWTMAQIFAINMYVDRKMPFTQEFMALRNAAADEYKQRKGRVRTIRSNRRKMLIMPWRIGRLHRHNVELLQQHRQEKADAAQEKKAKAEHRKIANKEANILKREKMMRKRAEKLAAKEGKTLEEWQAEHGKKAAQEAKDTEATPDTKDAGSARDSTDTTATDGVNEPEEKN